MIQVKLITTGITPRCINFAGKRPNVLCVALEGRVSTSSQPMDLLCASIGGGGAAWVHPSTCNGSSRMCQTLHGNKLLHSHWHLTVSDCRANSTTLQLFRFSSLASHSHVLLSGEQTVRPKWCRQTWENLNSIRLLQSFSHCFTTRHPGSLSLSECPGFLLLDSSQRVTFKSTLKSLKLLRV